jgi:DNA-binding beta-propeller fold protein YncE
VEAPRSAMEDLIYGKEATPTMNIHKPYGARLHDGKLYVCDIGGHCLSVLDLKERVVKVLGVSGGQQLQTPADLAIAPDGIKYLADRNLGQIILFDPSDRQISSFALRDFKPVALALWGDELYVCDAASQRVVVLDRRTGQSLRTIGEPVDAARGIKDGQFAMPIGIAFDPRGDLWVTDMMLCRAQKFSRDGKFVASLGTRSDAVGAMNRPKQIAIDKEGILYIVDSSFQNVQLFNETGRCLTFFGTGGPHPGAMFLPVGVSVAEGGFEHFQEYIHPAFEPQRLIVVTNQMGINKVSVYALGRLRPGKTTADVAEGRITTAVGIVAGGSATSRPGRLAPVTTGASVPPR